MMRYWQAVTAFKEQMDSLEVIQVPRKENQDADRLAKLASSLPAIDSRKITFLSFPFSQVNPEGRQLEELMDIDELRNSWMAPIVAYLKDNTLPDDPKEARKVKTKSARFFLIDDDLYKRSFSRPYLKCLTPDKANYVLREIHEGMCGNHSGGKSLAAKALRQGYFWPTMLKDAVELSRRCKACQEHAGSIGLPGAPMQPLDSPCPFAQWGLDIVGPFPRATGQRKFLIVAIDYFSKWVEAEALASISEKEVMKFLWKNIVCRFGIPRSLVSDNGTQFSGSKLRDWCQQLKIKHFFTSVANPQANGQAEVTNRTILQHLKTRLGDAKGAWPEELPSVLWAYRTTPRTATGESPFNLIYGAEAVVPAEIGEVSWRVKYYEERANDNSMRTNLDLADEVRDAAYIRSQNYKSRMAKTYNSRVRHRSFQVGDLVLRKAEASGPIGKLDAKWEGPYQIVEVVNPKAYRLQTIDGRQLPRTWNVSNLKRFYALDDSSEERFQIPRA